MSGVKNDLLKIVKCKCPKCGIAHLRKMEWTGRTDVLMRKRCSDCDNALNHNAIYATEYLDS